MSHLFCRRTLFWQNSYLFLTLASWVLGLNAASSPEVLYQYIFCGTCLVLAMVLLVGAFMNPEVIRDKWCINSNTQSFWCGNDIYLKSYAMRKPLLNYMFAFMLIFQIIYLVSNQFNGTFSRNQLTNNIVNVTNYGQVWNKCKIRM